MRRLSVFLLLPALALALETVNLIKDASFEKDDSIWIIEPWGFFEPIPAEGSVKDTLEKKSGRYSGSVDTREEPEWNRVGIIDSVAIRQEFLFPKTFADIDSLIWNQAVFPIPTAPPYTFYFLIGVTFGYPESNGFCYGFVNPEWTLAIPGWVDVTEEMPTDTAWEEFNKSCQVDFPGIDQGQELVSFTLDGWGYRWSGIYYGQKTYWDDIRLMGYADYDVGVKEILSEPAMTVDSPYVPTARIKNFGRENADSFLVIAMIEDSTSIVYMDSLPWSLEADTEDTVSFASFTPTFQAEYVLHVYTVMTPDESDADDWLSLDLYCSICQEWDDEVEIKMELSSPVSRGALRVSYSLPAGQLGLVSVFDISGRRITEVTVRGAAEAELPTDLTSGVYLVRLDSGTESVVEKAVILR